jgi:hypothetical protein
MVTHLRPRADCYTPANPKFDSWRRLGKTSADQIVYNMAHDPHWKKLDNWHEAQARADQGSIVIGGLRASALGEHGHLAVVFPTPAGTYLTKFASEGGRPVCAGRQ